jgi:hypothetical protein
MIKTKEGIIDMVKENYDTASILEGCHCKECGWPVVDVCCNDNFLDGVKGEDNCWDWWYYCSNKGCTNHNGEGVFQNHIDWVVMD